MEKLVDSGLMAGVIDLTTTEVADMLMGGVLPATEDRFGAIIRTRVPYVGSVGALDMVNFGALETVPARFRARNLYKHNPQVTLMRTTPAAGSVPGSRKRNRGWQRVGAGANRENTLQSALNLTVALTLTLSQRERGLMPKTACAIWPAGMRGRQRSRRCLRRPSATGYSRRRRIY